MKTRLILLAAIIAMATTSCTKMETENIFGTWTQSVPGILSDILINYTFHSDGKCLKIAHFTMATEGQQQITASTEGTWSLYGNRLEMTYPNESIIFYIDNYTTDSIWMRNGIVFHRLWN